MNQIYRALHMPPKRLIKKLSGQKEIYTIAVRRAPKGEGISGQLFKMSFRPE